jgi:glycosyltransferase involved in cell wall biosynthesis
MQNRIPDPRNDQAVPDPCGPRVLIVAEHASARFGGEAALPLHYFRLLRQRGFEVHLLVHARTRAELQALFPCETRIHYVEDSRLHRLLWRLGQPLPDRLAYFTIGFAMRLLSQCQQRHQARELLQRHGLQLVHQPMPVSPREPSLLCRLGVPVLIGPMNGNIDYPPAFGRQQSALTRLGLRLGRLASGWLNRCLPGKLEAAALLVANARTRAALPAGVRGRVYELVENGVDLGLWQHGADGDHAAAVAATTGQEDLVTFVFMGRLVDWKAVDLLLEAFVRASSGAAMRLLVVGEGRERAALEQQCRTGGMLAAGAPEQAAAGQVGFMGWRSQADCAALLAASDALVLPSLMECGGAVVLEAMACARPVIATAWGGPCDYLDASCGMLVEPQGREAMVAGLAAAMLELARSPALRERLGRAGRERVERCFDWERKADRMLEIYGETLAAAP